MKIRLNEREQRDLGWTPYAWLVYLIFYFMGGAAGSAGGSVAWNLDGWPGVCIAGLVIAALGGLLWAATVVGEITRKRRSIALS